MTEPQNLSPITKSEKSVLKTLLAGGVAGCCAKSTVAPFDRVKILLQAHHHHYRHLGVFATAKKVLRTEGITGLYKGNGAQMMRIFPYAATQFTSYEFFKQYLKDNFGDNQWTQLGAGSLAGMTAVLLTYPLDVVRARLAFQARGEVMYTGVVHAFRVILDRQGGVRGLYRGISPTMLGMVPYAGLSFYGFETLKRVLLERFPHLFGRPCPRNDNQLILIVPAKLICGGLAGAFAQTISYPLDVVRRRMQLSTMVREGHHHYRYRTWVSTLSYVMRRHGLRRGLFRGLSVNYIKVTPMVAVSFSVYEMMKQALGLDTHAETNHKRS